MLGQEIPIEGSGFDSAAWLHAQYRIDSTARTNVHYGAGRGGFSPQGPRPYTGRGGYF